MGLAAIWLCLSLSQLQAAEPVTVVELYTSQGCYSCPPADDLLGKLKQQPNVIALSCHVTYWNYLGWKDTFSLPFCDNRQRRYQSYLKGNTGVYTPQMVINGQYAGVGSRERRVDRLIGIAQGKSPLKPIELSLSGKSQLSIHLPDADHPQKQQLLLLGTSGQHRLPIARGENGGKRLTYHNPVEHVISLGEWNGQSKTLSKTVPVDESVEEWIVIAQSLPLGQMTAAGKLPVP